MSLGQSSFFYTSPLTISFAKSCEERSSSKFFNKSCFEKCGKLPKVAPRSLLFDISDHDHRENSSSCLTRSIKNVHRKITPQVLYNGYPYFTSPYHPLESDLLHLHNEHDHDDIINGGHIGIVNFFHGKNIFITGATGLVGKVFIEKLLRSTSVGKIYILIKSEDKGAALDRLEKEITQSELFKCLREKHGNCYEEFVSKKLIAVVGDICEPNLGMDPDSVRAITEEVDVIIGSAASTTLNDRYDFLLEINVNAVQRLMRFGKACKKLKLFVHMSTAYVNGRKEGLILEKPLIMGANGINKDDDQISSSPFPLLDVADEISLAMKTCRASSEYDMTKNLKTLGQERANFFGWYNAYHMTKAMGEMVLNEMRGDIPVLIIRPTVIESTYKEPTPGWIQGNRMFDPVIISYGRGQLPAFLADPQIHMDIIPVDMVVNTTIAAIAKHGIVHKPQLNVYQVASGVVNPLQFSDFFRIIHDYFNSTPLVHNYKSMSQIKCYESFKDFSKYTRDEMSKALNGEMKNNEVGADEKIIKKLQKQYKAKVAYAEQLCKMYEFIGFFKGRFHSGNTQKLLREMSEEEKKEFEIDVASIDWTKYFMDIHIPGLRNHVINGTRTSLFN